MTTILRMVLWFLRKLFISNEAIVAKVGADIARMDLETRRVNSLLF